MNAIAETVARGGTSALTQQSNPLAFIAVRLSLLGQDPEAYAKACHALADSTPRHDRCFTHSSQDTAAHWFRGQGNRLLHCVKSITRR